MPEKRKPTESTRKKRRFSATPCSPRRTSSGSCSARPLTGVTQRRETVGTQGAYTRGLHGRACRRAARGHGLRVTLCRGEKLNALSAELERELLQALERPEARESRAV